MGDVFYDFSKLSEMKTVDNAMEKKITKAEFEVAIKQITEEQMNDPDLKDKGMGGILLPLLTMTVAVRMKQILFDEEDE